MAKKFVLLCGKMVYQIWEASRTYEICVADSEGNVTKLHEEGVDLLDSNENGFLTDENGISFYDLSGNLQWSFNKYDVSSAWLYGKNVFVKLNGNDGNTYISKILIKKQESLYMNLFEYSCAVKPHVRSDGNRQSGTRKPLSASLLA